MGTARRVSFALLLLTACVGDTATSTAGTEGATCLSGGRCTSDFVCLSNLCVRADGGVADSGLDARSDAPSTDASDASENCSPSASAPPCNGTKCPNGASAGVCCVGNSSSACGFSQPGCGAGEHTWECDNVSKPSASCNPNGPATCCLAVQAFTGTCPVKTTTATARRARRAHKVAAASATHSVADRRTASLARARRLCSPT